MTKTKGIAPKQFVELWIEAYNTNQTLDWVATKLGVSRQAVIQKAGYMRARGVELPKMKLRVNQISSDDVDELNSLIFKEVKK